MTFHPQATTGEENDPRFESLLSQVLHEVANADPDEGFAARLHQAMNDERGSFMNACAMQTVPSSSILWTGRQPGSGWNVRGLFGAALIHALVILLIGLAVMRRITLAGQVKSEQVALVEPPPPPLKLPRKALAMGGGGGQKGSTPVTNGNPPKFSPVQLNPPKAPPLVQPKISVPVTVNVQPDLKMAHSDVPQIGMPNSPLVGMSMGNGRGTGLGSGEGNGIGPGSGGNYGGGLERIGGGVSAPVVLFQPEPEFSEEARKAKAAGNVLVYLQVDQNGRPAHVRVLRGIGLGLDEKAVAAVKLYRFRPAMKDGHPVAVEMNVEVTFQIF